MNHEINAQLQIKIEEDDNEKIIVNLRWTIKAHYARTGKVDSCHIQAKVIS
jgi:hypothetical protein